MVITRVRTGLDLKGNIINKKGFKNVKKGKKAFCLYKRAITKNVTVCVLYIKLAFIKKKNHYHVLR